MLYLSPVKGGVDAKELFHLYILVWIQDKRLSLLESCKLDKVHILQWYYYRLFFPYVCRIFFAVFAKLHGTRIILTYLLLRGNMSVGGLFLEVDSFKIS